MFVAKSKSSVITFSIVLNEASDWNEQKNNNYKNTKKKKKKMEQREEKGEENKVEEDGGLISSVPTRVQHHSDKI